MQYGYGISPFFTRPLYGRVVYSDDKQRIYITRVDKKSGAYIASQVISVTKQRKDS